ncbi:MAG: hypothetical protein NTW08_03210 [Gammaproteobacteria bacterium]|nr:hypothetical protein [Gammaproteobacteria bacterium]
MPTPFIEYNGKKTLYQQLITHPAPENVLVWRHLRHRSVSFLAGGFRIFSLDEYNDQGELSLRRQWIEEILAHTDKALPAPFVYKLHMQERLSKGIYRHSSWVFGNTCMVAEKNYMETCIYTEADYVGFHCPTESYPYIDSHPFYTLVTTHWVSDPHNFSYYSTHIEKRKTKKHSNTWMADIFEFKNMSSNLILMSSHGRITPHLKNQKITDPQGELITYTPSNVDHVLPDVVHLGLKIRTEYRDGLILEGTLFPLRYKGALKEGRICGPATIHSPGRIKSICFNEAGQAISIGTLRFVDPLTQENETPVDKPGCGFDMIMPNGIVFTAVIYPDTYESMCRMASRTFGLEAFLPMLSLLKPSHLLLTALLSKIPYEMYKHLMREVFPTPQARRLTPNLSHLSTGFRQYPGLFHLEMMQGEVPEDYIALLPEFYLGGHTGQLETYSHKILGYKKSPQRIYNIDFYALLSLFKQVTLSLEAKNLRRIDLYQELLLYSLSLKAYLNLYPEVYDFILLSQKVNLLSTKKPRSLQLSSQDKILDLTYRQVERIFPTLLLRLGAIYGLYQSYRERWPECHWKWALDALKQFSDENIKARDKLIQAQVDEEEQARSELYRIEAQDIQQGYAAGYADQFASIQSTEKKQRKVNSEAYDKDVRSISAVKRSLEERHQTQVKLQREQERENIVGNEKSLRVSLTDEQTTQFQGMVKQKTSDVQAIRFRFSQFKAQTCMMAESDSAHQLIDQEEQASWLALECWSNKERFQAENIEQPRARSRHPEQSSESPDEGRVANEGSSVAPPPPPSLPPTESNTPQFFQPASRSPQVISYDRYGIPTDLPDIFFVKNVTDYPVLQRLSIVERTFLITCYREHLQAYLAGAPLDMENRQCVPRLQPLMVPLKSFADLVGGWLWRTRQFGECLSKTQVDDNMLQCFPRALDALPTPQLHSIADMKLFVEFYQYYFYFTTLEVIQTYRLPLVGDDVAEIQNWAWYHAQYVSEPRAGLLMSLYQGQADVLTLFPQLLASYFANPEDCMRFQQGLHEAAEKYVETPIVVMPEVSANPERCNLS